MASALTSTGAIYAVLTARMLGYVPAAFVLPGQSVPVALSAVLGARFWVMAPQDNATMPFVVYRITNRQRDGYTHGLLETFQVEVDVFHRPRSPQSVMMTTAISDQIEVALTDFKEATGPLTIRALRARELFAEATSPADRDVVHEKLQFDGFMIPGYATAEVGTS